MKVYMGWKDERLGPVVFCNGEEFSAARSLKVRNHSPTGFAWGYGGSGPSQLALALLLDVVGQDLAERLYQRFKAAHVARFGDDWRLSEDQIRRWAFLALGEPTEREAELDF